MNSALTRKEREAILDRIAERRYERQTALNRLHDCKLLLAGRRHLREIDLVIQAIERSETLLENTSD